MNYKPVQREEKKVNGITYNSKVDLDKYYTPTHLAKYCIDKTYEIIGRENITEIIEPSAGNGSFSNQIDRCIAYDIEPDGENIVEQDYLELELGYKKGRLIIGNPPYGSRNTIAVKFFKKAIKECDYISFILPKSQLNNNQQLYEFDLIYSEKIDSKSYVDLDKRVELCFNIYSRPKNDRLNKKPSYKFKDIQLVENRAYKGYKDVNYDFRICNWGQKCGKILSEDEFFAQEIAFYIKNDSMKKKIQELIKDVDLKDFNISSTPKLNQWQIYEYILKEIPELQ